MSEEKLILSQLPPNELRKYVEYYYTGQMKTLELMDLFGLKKDKEHRFFNDFLPAADSGKTCPYCGGRILYHYPSKSLYKAMHKKGETCHTFSEGYICENCGHKPFVESCHCIKCNEVREQKRLDAEKTRWEKFKKLFPPPKKEEMISLFDIDDINHFFITLAILIECHMKNKGVIKPISSVFDGIPLAPTEEITEDFWDDGFSCYFAVEPDNTYHKSAYHIDQNGERVFYKKDAYLIPKVYEFYDNDFPESVIKKIQDIAHELPEKVYQDWMKIQEEEAMQLYLMELEDSKLNVAAPGVRVKTAIPSLIKKISLGQLGCCFFRQSSYAQKFYTSRNVSKRHAMNTVIGNVERYVKLVEENGWNIHENDCWKFYQRSVVGMYFYAYVLPLGDDSVRYIPNLKTVMDILAGDNDNETI